MSAIQGIIITSLDGRLILHSSFRHPLSTFPLLNLDKLNSEIRANGIHSTATATTTATATEFSGTHSTSTPGDHAHADQQVLPVLWVEGVPTIKQANRQLLDEQEEEEDQESHQQGGQVTEQRRLGRHVEAGEGENNTRFNQSTPLPSSLDDALPIQDDSSMAWNQQAEASSNLPSSSATLMDPNPNIWSSSSLSTELKQNQLPNSSQVQSTTSNLHFQSGQEALDHVNALAEQGAALIHVQEGQLRFLCPVIGQVNPLLPLSFLRHFILILHHYLTPNFNSQSSSSSSSLSSLAASLPSSIANSLPTGTSQSNATSSAISTAAPPLTETQIRDHFPLVYHLLEEMLDDGNMLTTEWNQLRDVVIKEGWSEAVKRRMGIAGEVVGSPAISSPFSSPIPWRRAQSNPSINPQSAASSSSYNQSNEIYFDIVEKLEVVISSKGKILSGENWGRILGRSKLKGFPDLTVKFQKGNQNLIVDPAFHRSVRNKRWWDEGVLSFCPPDGNFLLAEFRVGANDSSLAGARMMDTSNFLSEKSSSDPSMSFNQNPNRPRNQENFMRPKDFNKVLPLQLKSKLNLNSNSSSSKDDSSKRSSFEIHVSSSLSSASQSLKSLTIKFSLGEGSNNVDLSSSISNSFSSLGYDPNAKSLSGGGSASGSGTSTPLNASQISTYHFDPIKSSVTWEIPNLQNQDGTLKLAGTWETSSWNSPLPSNSILSTFEIQSHSISGLKIESISLSGENYKMFKGVRNCVEGAVEWRW